MLSITMMSKKLLLMLTSLVLVGAVATPLCFPEQAQVLLSKFKGAETFLYPNEIDLGDFDPGATTSATFRAYNFTSNEIEITSAITTCGCVTHEELPKMIPAHSVVDLTIDVRLPKYKPDFDQSVTYLISESRGMAMRKARILASIPNPLPPPPENEADESNAENSDAEEEANVEEADSSSKDAQNAGSLPEENSNLASDAEATEVNDRDEEP